MYPTNEERKARREAMLTRSMLSYAARFTKDNGDVPHCYMRALDKRYLRGEA